MEHITKESIELKSRITQKYFKLGMEQGFSKVLLDQVASELSISKKTIYKFFSSKEEIISACIDDVFLMIDAEILPIIQNESINIIDKIILIPNIVAKHLLFFSKEQVIEIQRSFPHLWDRLSEQRKEKINRYEMLFQAAQDQGYIVNIDPQFIVHFYMTTIEAFTKENFMEKHSLSYADSLRIVNDILLNGILNKKNL